MTVGVVVPDITNAVFPPILRGIEDTLTPQGYIAMIANSDSDPKRESMLIDTLRARGVDGLILASAQREDPAISRAVEEGIPIVTVNRQGRRSERLVGHQRRRQRHRAGGTPHDRARAIGQIAHIAGPRALSTGLMRHEAFLAALRSGGIAPDGDLIASQHRLQRGRGRTLLPGAARP